MRTREKIQNRKRTRLVPVFAAVLLIFSLTGCTKEAVVEKGKELTQTAATKAAAEASTIVENYRKEQKENKRIQEEEEEEEKHEKISERDIEDQVCATKYPVLLVHGVFFRDTVFLNYWGRIPEDLQRKGAKLYYGDQQSRISRQRAVLSSIRTARTIPVFTIRATDRLRPRLPAISSR